MTAPDHGFICLDCCAEHPGPFLLRDDANPTVPPRCGVCMADTVLLLSGNPEEDAEMHDLLHEAKQRAAARRRDQQQQQQQQQVQPALGNGYPATSFPHPAPPPEALSFSPFGPVIDASRRRSSGGATNTNGNSANVAASHSGSVSADFPTMFSHLMSQMVAGMQQHHQPQPYHADRTAGHAAAPEDDDDAPYPLSEPVSPTPHPNPEQNLLSALLGGVPTGPHTAGQNAQPHVQQFRFVWGPHGFSAVSNGDGSSMGGVSGVGGRMVGGTGGANATSASAGGGSAAAAFGPLFRHLVMMGLGGAGGANNNFNFGDYAADPDAIANRLFEQFQRQMGNSRPASAAALAALPRVTVTKDHLAESAVSSAAAAHPPTALTTTAASGADTSAHQQPAGGVTSSSTSATEGPSTASSGPGAAAPPTASGNSQGKFGPCAVCLEQPVEGDVLVRLPCDHYFHEACVVPWLHEHTTCPQCRFSLPQQ